MSRPTASQREELDALAGELHDHGRIIGLDVSSTRVHLALKDGATLRIGWRPVGLELSLHEAGEDPEGPDEVAEVVADALPDPPAVSAGSSANLPRCQRDGCGHVELQHRKRGDGPAYCEGIISHPGTFTDDPEPPWSEPCGCPGFVKEGATTNA